MIDISSFHLFILTSITVILMPGPAMLFVISRGLTGGIRASIYAALGTTAGVSFHLFCAAFGLAVLLQTSALAFTAVKFAGAAYLVYLAIKTLVSKEPLAGPLSQDASSAASIFCQGILINILNPKLSIFFLAFLPQFIDPQPGSVAAQTLILGALFMAMTIVVFIAYAIFSSLLRQRVLSSPRVVKTLRWCFSSVFLALGMKLALSER
ncbi:LysE family translocator [Desulfogranum mediterraneum]|uniref:LysE family translocator n=1 Tax=Desulfogranum mediterraneum TaxID=160661 RepID=UPI00040D7505|nr:LysE family translocator [Desulfogranum mediterraneum]